MKVKELIQRIQHIAATHGSICAKPGKTWNCAGFKDILKLIADNPVRVRPAAPPQVELQPIVVKPPTWVNRDGEEVIIESMTPAHLANTIAFVERVRTERGEAALSALRAEMKRRWTMANPFADPRMDETLDNADL